MSKIGKREVGCRLWSAEGDWWKTVSEKNHKNLTFWLALMDFVASSFEEMVVPIVKRRGRKRKGNSVCSPTKKPLEEGGGRGGLYQLLQGAREAEVP